MNDVMPPKPRFASTLLPALALATVGVFSAPSSAQLPENVAIVGTISYALAKGNSGLYYVTLPTSANAGGARRAIAPLPKELIASPTSGVGGCYSVLYRPSDGTIFVGGGAGRNGLYHVHILKVAGPIVTKASKVLVGQVPNLAGNSRTVGGMAFLPNGRVLVAFDPATAKLSGRTPSLAILDDRPATPTLTPVLTNPFLGPFMNGLALSPDGRTAYVTTQTSFPNFFPARLYSVDLTKTTRVTPVLLHTWTKRMVVSLTADRAGVLYATAGDPVNTTVVPGVIEEIRIVKGAAVVKSIPITINAVPTKVALVGPALDCATGRFVFVSALSPSTVHNNSVLTSDRKGNLKVLAGPPPLGWGMPIAIGINNAFETYGQTKTSDRHWFQKFPNPGGLPEVGNSKFSLTLRSKTAPSNSFLVVGAAKSNFPLMGITVLARPGIVIPVTASTSTTIGLPIPNLPIFKDVRAFVQGVHVELGGGFGATRGLDLAIQ